MEKRFLYRVQIPGAHLKFKKLNTTSFFSTLSEPARIENLSKSGLAFSLNEALPSGEELVMKLFFPDGKKLLLKGHIRWSSRMNSDAHYTVGVQFHPYGNTSKYNSTQALEYLRSIPAQQLQIPEELSTEA